MLQKVGVAMTIESEVAFHKLEELELYDLTDNGFIFFWTTC